MGSRQQVNEAGRTLRDSLQERIDDGAFSQQDREDFSRIHLALVRRLQNFARSPRFGEASKQYDIFVGKAGAAAAAVRSCDPSARSSIEDARSKAVLASDALSPITASAAAPRTNLLYGALKLRTSAPGGDDTHIFKSSVEEDSEDKKETGSEPYYQSLVKLFPVEAVALYPLAVGIAGDDAGVLRILVAVIALVVVGLRYFATKPAAGGPTEWPAIIVALLSFLLYAASLGAFGILYRSEERTAMLLSFVTIIWIAFVPYILRRSEPAS